MYLNPTEITTLLDSITKYFEKANLLVDCYTEFSAKASKYKNPINDVGVTEVYGIDDPKQFEISGSISFVKEHNITPDSLINELKGMEKGIFKRVYGGGFSKKLYRMYEYKKI